MTGLPITIYLVDTRDGGKKEYVSCLTNEQVFSSGLRPQAIMGLLLRPPGSEQPITPEGFSPNPAFIDFMHGVIARRGPEMQELIASAQRQREGWIYVIDQRTPDPQGKVGPEDIV